jgi:dienelactone hydrolase
MPPAIHARRIADIPALIAAPDADRPARGRRPVVVWYHGFNASKEAHEAELARVASLGMLAVGVDAVGHGERRLPDFDERKTGPMEHVRAFMLERAAATAAELPRLVTALADTEHADPHRVSLVGTSMGGYLVYRAVADQPDIHAAVALLGSPEWPGDPRSPHRRPDAFARTALLSITAQHDESVPPAAARAFHTELTARSCRSAPSGYRELADAPHLMNGAQWATAMDATMDWLRRYGT